MTDSTGNGGDRAEGGKFKAGNPIGKDTRLKKGDKRRATPASIRAQTRMRKARTAAALSKALTPKRIQALVDSLEQQALRGDSGAAKTLLAYAIGTPRQAPPPQHVLEVPDVSKPGGAGELMARLAKEAAEGSIDADFAQQVANLLRGVVDAQALEEAQKLAEHLGAKALR